MYFGDWLSRWKIYSSNKIGLIDYVMSEGELARPQSYTYAELYRRSNRAANFLRERGVQRGDRVAMLAQNCVEHIDLFFATAKLGAMLVPLNFRLAFAGLEYILNDTAPALFFAAKEFDDCAQSLARAGVCPPPLLLESEFQNTLHDGDSAPPSEFRLEQSDPHLILYTSGTTGHPKGALITHGQMMWNSLNTAISLQLTGNDISTIHTPFYHTGGWNVLTTPIFHFGGQLVLMRRWDAEALMKIIETYRVSIFSVCRRFLK